jgi:hypothetical protein
MKNNDLHIFIDRLVNEGEFEHSGTLDPAILGLNEQECIAGPILYQLKAYLADDHLVVTFDVKSLLKIPCKICNEFTDYDVNCTKQTHLEPLNELKKGFYDASECLTEAILINIPPFYECEGNCPQRASLAPFLKKETKKIYSPFDEL